MTTFLLVIIGVLIVVFALVIALLFKDQKKLLNKQLLKNYQDLQKQIEESKQNLKDCESRVSETKQVLVLIDQEASKYKEEKMKDAEHDLQIQLQALKETYKHNSEEFIEQNKQVVADQVQAEQEKIDKLKDQANQLQKTVNAALEIEKQQAEKEKYRLQVSESDIEDIKKLRELIPQLKNKEILGKLIYKTYYEKAYNDLINRIFGDKRPIGIYKITEIGTSKCYVGQSVNVAERFRQHIKCGVGADTGSNNKLYTAMLSLGVENFTFELIEECDRAQLNDREDYWQEFYGAIKYGYSIK